eukprot:gene8532-10487_t
MSYKTSSQLKKWMFPKQIVQQFRDEINEKLRLEITERSPASISNILTPDEELKLLFHYQTKIFDIASVLSIPDKVSATAIVYLKRFFLTNSVMKYDPKKIMICCLFLACKTEDNHIDIGNYSEIVKCPESEITDLEIIILETLQFYLIVYHPYRPLYGFLLDINDTNPTSIQFDQLWELSNKFVKKSLYSDLCFHYHPSMIALACLDLAWGPDQFSVYFQNKFNQNNDNNNNNNNVNNTLKEINEIKLIIQNIPDTSNLEIVKKIDRKLIYLNNPEKEKKKSSTKKPSKKKLKVDNNGNGNSTTPPTTTTTATTTTTKNSNTPPPDQDGDVIMIN